VVNEWNALTKDVIQSGTVETFKISQIERERVELNAPPNTI